MLNGRFEAKSLKRYVARRLVFCLHLLCLTKGERGVTSAARQQQAIAVAEDKEVEHVPFLLEQLQMALGILAVTGWCNLERFLEATMQVTSSSFFKVLNTSMQIQRHSRWSFRGRRQLLTKAQHYWGEGLQPRSRP